MKVPLYPSDVQMHFGEMIALRDQEYYVPGLTKDLRIISPKGICTSEGYKGTFISHFHDEHDGYAELNLKEDKLGLQKAEPVERVYAKYKGIVKGLEISGFGIVEYSVRSESGRMIALRVQAYYVPGLPKDLLIIYPQGIHTSEGYKGTFIYHCNDDHDGYS